MTRRIYPRDVKIGDRIMCRDQVAREVVMIHHLGGQRYRFIFTDDRWIEYRPGTRATVVVDL